LYEAEKVLPWNFFGSQSKKRGFCFAPFLKHGCLRNGGISIYRIDDNHETRNEVVDERTLVVGLARCRVRQRPLTFAISW